MIIEYTVVNFAAKVLNPLSSGAVGVPKFQAKPGLRLYRDTDRPETICIEAANGTVVEAPWSLVTTAKRAKPAQRSAK